MSDKNEDLFQRLSLDDSLRRTFSIYCKGFFTFTKLGAAVLVVNQFVWMVILPMLTAALGVTGTEFSDPEYLKAHMGAFWALSFVNLVLTTLTGAVGEGTMIKAVSDIYLGREPDFFACIRVGARKTCALMSASMLAVIGSCIGYFLFFFPGLYLSVVWFLIGPVIVVEGCSIFASLKRSQTLVSGSWCYTLCINLIVFIFFMIFQFAWDTLFPDGNDAGHTLFSVWGSLMGAIPTFAWLPIIAIMRTIMYINLRVEKEGLDAEIFASDLREGGGNVLSYQQISLMGEEKDYDNNISHDV